MKIKNELPLLIIVALPLIYLASIWNRLPRKIPVHWNMHGEIDRWGNKNELLFIVLMLPVFTYVLFLVIPKIDPKGQLEKMGKKYQNLKFLLTGLMSALAMFIIYSAQTQSLLNAGFFVFLLGILYVVAGNYFKTLQPNYFIGIRTPWTLENQKVWKKTHQLAGKLWFGGGILIILSNFVFNNRINFIVLMAISILIILIPVVYSYHTFKEITRQ